MPGRDRQRATRASATHSRRSVLSAADYAALPTEHVSTSGPALDTLDALELVDRIQDADARAVAAVRSARQDIAAGVTLIAEALRAGGRLIYVGAGTSGRLAVLDAAECPPTFNTAPRQVTAILAGGATALRRAVEGAEDDAPAARRALAQRRVAPPDVICGVSASGVTPFVRSALAEARRRRCATLLVTAAPPALVAGLANVVISLPVGPELVAGSTRMKAGLATKAVLHTLTTATMIRLGKVHGQLMVDVRPGSRKLRHRALRIVQQLTGLAPTPAARLLRRAGDRPKVATVMFLRGVTRVEATRLLARADGFLRPLLEGC
jgi:N-acetylmuramic acid 6-phosphate etherase